MSSPRIGHAEREHAVERLAAPPGGGRLGDSASEDRVVDGRTGAGLGPLPADLTVPAVDTAEPAAAVGSPSLRDRVGDWLVRALRCAVFCWLPPPSGRDQPGR
ncbi:DUF1707 domain-containing protein [Streptomyces sp. A3M-1-3]|uniref:DUF1707 domain-containing protein n=1 Tax=Streptomyces sp. A3M-1-3 TaxID=2962044 RepID=UPI0020B857B3|nr:DUF1707 domain-containing protein [Streptomyces sp. A3M-1-3]MCP3818517.1 DUF1707 domain-containing protein [Streptomyces sp. A3M-1-3]